MTEVTPTHYIEGGRCTVGQVGRVGVRWNGEGSIVMYEKRYMWEAVSER